MCTFVYLNISILPPSFALRLSTGSTCHTSTFKLVRVLPLWQVRSKQGGEGSTLENEHAECEAAEAKRHLQEYAIDCEEDRLQQLEQIAELKRNFGRRQMGAYSQNRDRILAGGRAIRLIEAILQDDEEQMILALDSL